MAPSEPLRGMALLQTPGLNKSTAFTAAERDALGLRGLLPPRVHTLDEQLRRVRRNFEFKRGPVDQYIFLNSLQDRNETLFYRFVMNHLTEMMPILYTPTVGEACKVFGHIFRRPRGLYVSIADRGHIREVLKNWPVRDISVLVVTDGERILGLGDLGAHGMGIPIGKLSLYVACAGISPSACLPIALDVGTDNPALLDDPLYIGLSQKRVRGPEYQAFIEEFVQAVQEIFPSAVLQWEDFATDNAIGILAKYRDRLCTFNDDIQGTAAVVLAALQAACRLTRPLTEQRLLFHGAGASATGVANLIVSGMVQEGLSEAEARRRCWFVDSQGLVVAGRTGLAAHKQPYAHAHAPVRNLVDAVRALQPTALIGFSAQAGAFDEAVLHALAKAQPRPIVFALSNPTSKAECSAEEAYRHTAGTAIFASGSPFDPVTLNGRTQTPSQANNAYIFPGLGLGLVLSRATRVTDGMFHVAAKELSGLVSQEALERGSLLPPLTQVRKLSLAIAAAVVKYARDHGLAQADIPEDVEPWVQKNMYEPKY